MSTPIPQPRKLEGKVALITGGNSGIGLATARLFKAEGAKAVIITASSPASFAKAQKELGKEFDVVQCDVRDLKQLDALYAHVKAKYGGLDVLFANSGKGTFIPFKDVTPEYFDDVFSLNVKGLYFSVQKALPLLREGSKVIVNASIVATRGFPNSDVYSASKAAVRSFVRVWTAEYPPSQIRFTSISPGPTFTPILEKNGMTADQAKAAYEGFAAGSPIKRVASPEEMANAVLFLASDQSSYVAGFDLVVDGGLNQV